MMMWNKKIYPRMFKRVNVFFLNWNKRFYTPKKTEDYINWDERMIIKRIFINCSKSLFFHYKIDCVNSLLLCFSLSLCDRSLYLYVVISAFNEQYKQESSTLFSYRPMMMMMLFFCSIFELISKSQNEKFNNNNLNGYTMKTLSSI